VYKLAEISATSSEHGHSVQNIVDNDENTFWASAFDAAENVPVDIEIPFGSTKHVIDFEISWEYPAKSFDIQVASGGTWSSFFSTSDNNLNLTAISAHSVRGSKLRIRMHEVGGSSDGASVACGWCTVPFSVFSLILSGAFLMAMLSMESNPFEQRHPPSVRLCVTVQKPKRTSMRVTNFS